jgi:hypothetical protein
MGLHGEPTQDGHSVVFVDENALPAGVNWALIEFDGELHCIVKRTCVTEDVLEDAWGGYRAWGQWLSRREGGHTPQPGCCPLVGHDHARTG